MANFPVFMMFSFLNTIVGWTGSKDELSAYSLAHSTKLVHNFLIHGFNSFTRTQLNYLIGKKSSEKAWAMLKKILVFGMVLAGILVLLSAVIFQITMKIGTHGNLKTIQILNVLQYWMFVNLTILVYAKVIDSIIYSFEYFNYMTLANTINTFITIALGYYLCISKGLGSVGMYAAITLSFFLILVSNFSVVFCYTDWKETIEGENGLHKRVKNYNSSQK